MLPCCSTSFIVFFYLNIFFLEGAATRLGWNVIVIFHYSGDHTALDLYDSTAITAAVLYIIFHLKNKKHMMVRWGNGVQ